MKKILFIELWNCSPHLETALELSKLHLDMGDRVWFYFCGHDAGYKDGIAVNLDECGVFRPSPESLGISLIKSPRLRFYTKVRLPSGKIQADIEFRSLRDLIAFKYLNFDAGVGVASSLVSDTRDSNPDLAEHRANVLAMLESCISLYEFTKATIAKHQPDLLYVFNGRFANHRAIMVAANEAGVSLRFHERGGSPDRYAVLPFMPHDSIKIQEQVKDCWLAHKGDSQARSVAEAFFRDRRAGMDQGWTSYTKHQQRDLLPQLDSGKKIVTYFSSSEDEHVSLGDLFVYETWPSQFAAVQALIEVCREDPNIQLWIRLHPHKRDKSVADQNRWLSLGHYPGVNLISFTSVVDTYALIERSDIVITAGSTVGVEACFWGRPSISLGPSYYSELEVVYQPKSTDELKLLLGADRLEPCSVEGALAYGYYMTSFGERFRYYQPETLFKGKFLGVDLHAVPASRQRWLACKRWLQMPFRLLSKLMPSG